MEKVNQLTTEAAFADGLRQHATQGREIYRADRPGEKVVLDPQSPIKAIEYFYQLRSNITHRGKGVVRDHERILKSLSELLSIFRGVLKAARTDAQPNTAV